MIQDRIGILLLVIAAAWMTWLAFTDAGQAAPGGLRNRLLATAIVLMVAAFFPRHLSLTGTVLVFAVLGLCLNIGLFGLFGMEQAGLLPLILTATAIFLRRHRLDSDAVVVIAAAAACGIAMVQPGVLLFAMLVIAAVNIIIWLLNAIGSFRSHARS